jgi:hypothetical protein
VNARASSIYEAQQDPCEAVRNKQRLPYQEQIRLKNLAQKKKKRRSEITNVTLATLLQLLHELEKWTKRIDQGFNCAVAYMDFQKAFDTVPH